MNANAAALRWMLDRPLLNGAFLNTKLNSITLLDYADSDGWRGPGVTFGWIQGRGLEALVTHARFFKSEDPDLAARLDAAARLLYPALSSLFARDGHAYFAYDAALAPVFADAAGELHPQKPAGDVWTFSDIFVLKGLIAASARFAPEDTARHVAALMQVVRAIEEGRFVSDERQPLDAAALAAERGDFGPRMIMLGAAALLRDVGEGDAAAFGFRFIDHVLATNMIREGQRAGVLADKPGDDVCNPGHAIEFAGFGLDLLPPDADAALVSALQGVMLASFDLGFTPPGLRLKVSLATGEALAPTFPWWSLPEAVRAAALAWERTRDPAALAAWRKAHDAFFAHYWRGEPPIAYQTRTLDGAVDFVPATPDLDPGYHTGLSFLGAIKAIDRVLAKQS